MKPQRHCFRAVEFRASDSSDGFTLEGYAAVFDSPTRIDSFEGTFEETISRGAFSKTISERMPVLQFDHGKDVRTGSVPIGAIEELLEDNHGLFVRARLFDNGLVEPIRQAIAGGAIDGMSFRFRVVRDEWTDSEGRSLTSREVSDRLYRSDSGLQRNIKEVELYELGPVVFPAYAATSVGVRSILAGLDDDERRELVKELADELRITQFSDAARTGTSDETPDADQPVTSGLTAGKRRESLYRFLRKGK